MANQAKFGNGTFGHSGISSPGEGYGPMCGLSSLVTLSWVMMDKVGVAVDHVALKRAVSALDMQLPEPTLGRYGYGWGPDTRHIPAVIDQSQIRSSLGDLYAGSVPKIYHNGNLHIL